jgi:adenylate kinase family enzyme
VLPFYRAKGVLRTVDGMQSMDEVTRDLKAALEAA